MQGTSLALSRKCPSQLGRPAPVKSIFMTWEQDTHLVTRQGSTHWLGWAPRQETKHFPASVCHMTSQCEKNTTPSDC